MTIEESGSAVATPSAPSSLNLAAQAANMDENVEYWIDTEHLRRATNPRTDVETWEILTVSGEEEEDDDDFGSQYDDEESIYGLEEDEIREYTVEGTYHVQGRPSHGNSTVTPDGNDGDDPHNLCCICQETFQQDERIRTLPCFHIYHLKCVDQWLRTNQKCPMCKTSVIPDS